jgi:transposase
MDYHAQPDRSHARLQVSRPTPNAWIRRFEAERFAGLVDKPRRTKHPRKVWLPLIVPVYSLLL